MHVYYVFESPVPMFPNVVPWLQKLKYGLTEWIWNRETSRIKERQFQGIYQSFHMVGSPTKLGTGEKSYGKYRVRAWTTGRPVTIEYLNRFVDKKYQCPISPEYSSWAWTDEHLSLEECRLQYPEWYQRRIVQKKPPNQWVRNPKLYRWLLGKISDTENVCDGNRYHCISMLYVYGLKCGLTKDEIDADAYSLLELYQSLTVYKDNMFTKDGIYAAGKFYDGKFVRMTRKKIERRTGIRIEPSVRRNGRSQEEHLKMARIWLMLSKGSF